MAQQLCTWVKCKALVPSCITLSLAPQNGDLDVVRLLLEAGAQKDIVMQDGATALHLAAQNGHLDVVRLLLEAGAHKDTVMQDGATALHLAAQNGHSDVVRLLQPWE